MTWAAGTERVASPPEFFPKHWNADLTPEDGRQARWKNHQAPTAWRRNAEKDLVNFKLDASGHLVGQIRHPVGHLDEAELLLYLQTLATEGDRFEYVLTGSDVH